MAVVIALLAATLLLPARSLEQVVACGSLGVALAVMWVWGCCAERAVLAGGSRLRLGPFTRIYLGQLALLAAAGVLLPLNAALAGVGLGIPLVWLLSVATLAAARGGVRMEEAPSSPIPSLLTLAGTGSLAVVMALYSRHLSALGLDLHEHATWARQIVHLGFVPLAEPGTRILSDYPRTFHLLVALWDAAGLGAPIGPWAKVMPFLQAALPALALAEALAEAAEARLASRRTGLVTGAALAVAFGIYAFALVPMAYPVLDLLGTPRFSASGLLLLPIVLVVLGFQYPQSRARRLALACLPLVAVWCLTTNPVLPLVLAAMVLPATAAMAVALPGRAGEGPRWGKRLAGFAGFGLVAVLVAWHDPWILWQAARRAPAVDELLARAGVLSWERAERQGLVPDRLERSRRPPRPAPRCGPRCVLRHAGAALGYALHAPVDAGASAARDLRRLLSAPGGSRDALRSSLPPWPATVSDHAALPWAAATFAGLLALAYQLVSRRQPSLAHRLLAASIVGNVLGGIGLLFAARLAELILPPGQREMEVLVAYLSIAARHASIAHLWRPLAGAVAVLLELGMSARARVTSPAPASPRRPLAAATVVAGFMALPLAARLNLDLPARHRGFWSPVGLSDLAALREVERPIPPDEAVLIPAEHWSIGEEEWVIPVGDTTALLPYGERSYLFNVYLGRSYRYGWRDLEQRLCSPDPATRRAFAERARLRWLLARAAGARTAAEVAARTRICDQPIEALGEVTVAVQERDLVLFRFRVP